MKSLFLKALGVIAVFFAVSAAEECPRTLFSAPAVVSAEGRFVNRENIPVHVDLMWQHLPESADTFDISLSSGKSFRYVSSPDFRYLEYRPGKIPRQMAMHHLKEFIGESPIKWDDLELLSQGAFLCNDSLHPDTSVLYTAKSQAWFRAKPNTAEEPDSVTLFGARSEKRYLRIHSWRDYDGLLLPAIVDFTGEKDSGVLWVRTARKIYSQVSNQETIETSEEKVSEEKKSNSPLWNGLDRESKITLILQMQ